MDIRTGLLSMVLVLLFALPLPALAQGGEEWTCDEGENDILLAAQAAFAADDFDRAEELANEAQTVCAGNFMRSLDVVALLNEIQAARSAQEQLLGLTYAGVPYVPDGTDSQVLDLILPPDTGEPLPVVILYHGYGQDRRDLYRNGTALADAGYAAVIAEYMLPDNADYGASLADAVCAAAWVYEHAEAYGLDPDRVALLGFSLGGGLAATIGAVDDPALLMDNCPSPVPPEGWIRGVVVWSGAFVTPALVTSYPEFSLWASLFDLDDATFTAALEALANAPRETWLEQDTWPEEVRRIVPALTLAWIDGSEPPFLFVHGESDTALSNTIAETLAATLTDSGIDVEYVRLPNAGHMGPLRSRQTEESTLAFLAEHLGSEAE